MPGMPGERITVMVNDVENGEDCVKTAAEADHVAEADEAAEAAEAAEDPR